jgi:hypothetical protein
MTWSAHERELFAGRAVGRRRHLQRLLRRAIRSRWLRHLEIVELASRGDLHQFLMSVDTC